MKIYHYTTVDSLAQILKHKTIRFNRLDKVDDLEEGSIHPNGIKVGHYTFVSCWTESNEENISLWKLYTNSGIGVRICLEWDMFKDYVNPDKMTIGGLPFTIKGTAYEITKTPLSDALSPQYFVLPVGKQEVSCIYKKVEYVNDMERETAHLVKRIFGDFEHGRVTISLRDLGRYKNKCWAFQEESRFCLAIFPGKQFSSVEDFLSGINKWAYESWVNNYSNSISYYDMSLRDDIFSTLEITLSPGMPESQRIIVEALKEKYAPSAIIRESHLDSKVNLNTK